MGAFAPFMTGLLFGTAVLSMMMMYWAKQDILKLQQQRLTQEKTQADDISQAMELAILTETKETYSDRVNLNRAAQFTTQAQLRTRGGQGVEMVTRERDSLAETPLQRTLVAPTDDALTRTEMRGAADADDLFALATDTKQPVAVFDSEGARNMQIKRSRQNMEEAAEQVYAFFAGELRFPTQDEYAKLGVKERLRDVWGQEFAYTEVDKENAKLEFTTPWGYTYILELNVTPDPLPSEIAKTQNATTTTTPSPTTP